MTASMLQSTFSDLPAESFIHERWSRTCLPKVRYLFLSFPLSVLYSLFLYLLLSCSSLLFPCSLSLFPFFLPSSFSYSPLSSFFFSIPFLPTLSSPLLSFFLPLSPSFSFSRFLYFSPLLFPPLSPFLWALNALTSLALTLRRKLKTIVTAETLFTRCAVLCQWI